jgi:hypothetical protein
MHALQPVDGRNRAMTSCALARRFAASLMLWTVASATAQPQPGGSAQAAYRLCDARAFVAMNIARTYLLEGRNKELVLDAVKNHAWGQAMAQALFRRDETGELKHHAEFATDILYQCAIHEGVTVGAPKSTAQVCLARSDIAFYLHADRSRGLVRQEAVARTTARLTPRALYPTALVNAVAEAVYAPAELPELRQLAGKVVWACINSKPAPASAVAR